MSNNKNNFRKYYSNRNNQRDVTIEDIYIKFCGVFNFFKDKNYFYQNLDISHSISDFANQKAIMFLGHNIFPIEEWDNKKITDNYIFDTIEFLFDNISKPGERQRLTTETGFNYTDYVDYDEQTAQNEFRKYIDNILNDYKDGFVLTKDGEILSNGSKELSLILDANVINYDYENVDSIVKKAIKKWRNRELNLDERKEAIILMANVFEWLKKQDKLKKVLNKKDNSVIFNIANNFSLRHHNPDQIQNYDQDIWYSWIFHFYLATYHAVIRLIKKYEN